MKQKELTRTDIFEQLERVADSGFRAATVYADPPWPYRNTASRGAAANHYRTMSLAQIKALPVYRVIQKNAHLHLWTTNGLLREAFDVMKAWGFRYKSAFVWIKPQMGLGNYWRVSHEFLLFGVRGSLAFQNHSQKSWLMHSRLRHSEKPQAIRELVELVSPAPYLELFGRQLPPNDHWLALGNEVPLSKAA